MRSPRSDRRARILLGTAVALAVAVRLDRALRHADFFEDGYQHWWMAARLVATGEYGDPFARHAMGIWLPGYDLVAAGVLAVRGLHDVMALRVLSVALSALSTALVWRLARHVAPRAAAPAAFLFALHPFDIIAGGMPLPEPLAVALVLGAANLLLAPPRESWRTGGAALLAAACLVRYEAWIVALLMGVVLARVSGPREAALRVAPAAAVMAAWGVWTLASPDGLFATRIHAQLAGETAYHVRVGFVAADALGRLADFGRLYVVPLVLVLAPALVQTWREPRSPLVPLAWGLPVVLVLMVAAGITAGSPRYLSLAVPFLAVLAGRAWADAAAAASRRHRAGAALTMAVVLVGSAIGAAALGALVDKSAQLHGAKLRAGAWLAEHPTPGRVLVSESPAAAWRSGHDPALLVGSKEMPATREAALAWLREHVAHVVYVNNSAEKYSFYRLNALFPELAEGRSVEGFRLAYDPGNWEKDYGGQEVYVYAVDVDPGATT